MALPGIQWVAACILSLAGLPAGHALAEIAREEVTGEHGMRSLRALRALLAASILWFGLSGFLSQLGQLAVTVGVVFMLSNRRIWGASYGIWGLLLGMAPGGSALLTSLVFLFGLPEAALRLEESRYGFRLPDILFPVGLMLGLLL